MQHKRRLISLFVLVALLLSACQTLPPPPVAGTQAGPSDEDVTAAVNAIWDEYEASVIASDADRWIAQWTDDGVQMPPDEPLVEGKDNIFARVGIVMQAAPVDEFVITPLETQSAGDWAYSRGIYTVNFTFAATGEPGFIDGKFMTILQRQSDGSWKIYRDIFNSNVPPAAPSADLAALSAELHRRFSQNDLEGAAELAADDIQVIGYGLGLDFTGRDKFLAFMQARKSAFPDITLEHTNTVVQGDQVVVEFVATGTHLGTMNTPDGPIEATGKPITLHVVEIHTWKDGKLVHMVQYQDPTAPLKQIGAMK